MVIKNNFFLCWTDSTGRPTEVQFPGNTEGMPKHCQKWSISTRARNTHNWVGPKLRFQSLFLHSSNPYFIYIEIWSKHITLYYVKKCKSECKSQKKLKWGPGCILPRAAAHLCLQGLWTWNLSVWSSPHILVAPLHSSAGNSPQALPVFQKQKSENVVIM